MIYPTSDAIIEIHDEVILRSGGLAGIRSAGQLDSVLAHIRNDEYYPHFVDKLTHLVHSVAKFHLFNDGNKRTAILAGALFLDLNHFDNVTNLFIRGMEVPLVEAVENKITKDELREIIQRIMEI